MKVAFGCDHGGFILKDAIMTYLEKTGIDVIDYGCFSNESVDYPDYAEKVCDSVADKECDFGILVCGTGIGMSIYANKRNGIRCALLSDVFSARATREHNDTNVISMGGRILGPDLALDILDTFLHTKFSNAERHVKRIEKVMMVEKRCD